MLGCRFLDTDVEVWCGFTDAASASGMCPLPLPAAGLSAFDKIRHGLSVAGREETGRHLFVAKIGGQHAVVLFRNTSSGNRR